MLPSSEINNLIFIIVKRPFKGTPAEIDPDLMGIVGV